MSQRIVIVGAGYGGSALAHQLQDHAEVTLIDPRDAFVNIAGSLRALTRPDWAANIFFPLEQILPRGKHLRDKAISVDPGGVSLASGDRVEADYIVLATGSSYPYPANPSSDQTAAALTDFQATHQALAQAPRVLILGGGPVGLELAAEIREVWPNKLITVVEPGSKLLPAFLPEVQESLLQQLGALKIEILTGTRIEKLSDAAAGTLAAISATTDKGQIIEADIYFRAYGAVLNTGYLDDGKLTKLTDRAEVAVNPDLSVGEHRHVYAIGDITNIAEAKMAGYAGQHAAVVAQNILAQLAGREPTETYLPHDYPMILLPLGSRAGVGQLPSENGPAFAGAELVSEYKGTDIYTARFEQQFSISR
ncbi:NAD(P)/FAD-dependent oxidoreductase [Psychromicrobium lacuslunae]|uniref:Pyridine nucleotide-disulfide oxidoreductase n=1 Tax=Psychromicrobium lacuslunae TaxID=1618207 RepID=A0A0D4BXZ7_9MICC|nr:FAD-dependent oxidoreductase [Psychromicrobium lacuslunae]AJT41198.1 pyridine nucleotide-disulfide oxidoreductase [Psychromicrobium lacuslunae]